MEKMKCISVVISLLAALLSSSMAPVSGQITTACTSSLISSFTPCLNYLLGSTNGGGSPTAECCKALASVVSSSTDCACLILTGNVPFSLPLNRTLAISLPRLCRSTSVPLECKGNAMPLPSPGTISPSLPPLPPMQSEPPAPTQYKPLPPLPPSSPTPTSPLEPTSLSPSSPLKPASPPQVIGDANQGQRPLVLPSSAMKPAHVFLTSILPLLILGIILFVKS